MRTTDGLNGFALRTESEHDCYGAGHARDRSFHGAGHVCRQDQRGGMEHVVCVFGDAALTNGISFEALNNISVTTKKFIRILNDNEVVDRQERGAISTYLGKRPPIPGTTGFVRIWELVEASSSGQTVSMLGQRPRRR